MGVSEMRDVYATTVMVSLADGFKAPVIQVSARAA